MIISLCNFIGASVLHGCSWLGAFGAFFSKLVITIWRTRPHIKNSLHQMETIGIGSFPIVAMTGYFTGAVLALQSYAGFKRFGGQDFIGPVVALSMIRELGPVITGLMVAGRSGSAIAAEIGTMRVTEQIDALTTLSINPFQFLIVPRILAGILMLPCLSLFSTVCGIFGGYCIAVYIVGLSDYQYFVHIQKHVGIFDIISGLIKACCFGFIFSFIGTFKGFYARNGSRGVGKATTQSVVLGSILILLANFLLTIILLK